MSVDFSEFDEKRRLMEPEKKEVQTASADEREQFKKSAKFWIPACLALTAILLIFAVLLTYVLATDAQRKRDLRTIEEQKKIEEEQKQREEEQKVENLAVLESILRDRSLFGAELETEEFLKSVFDLYKEKSGDRYAAYYTEEEYRVRNAQLSGQTVGIGVTLDRTTVLYEGNETLALLVKSVFAGSPAEQSGLTVGEWIIAIGNTAGELQGIAEFGGYDKAILSISGEEGTEVALRILSGNAVREIFCRRQTVQADAVTGYCLEDVPGVAVIRIRNFSFGMPAQFCRAMEACRANGATNFILDVRDNPGGSMIALRAVLSNFMENGETIYCEKRADESLVPVICAPYSYTGEKEGCTVAEEQIGQYRDPNLHFAILCNENTISAAELFTAVLSKCGVAESFGQKTAGKWIAQTTMEAPFKNFKGYICFTVYQCFVFDGTTYQEIGYLPANEIALSDEFCETSAEELLWEQDLQLQAAVNDLVAKTNS